MRNIENTIEFLDDLKFRPSRKQKFQPGEIVFIGDCGSMMTHFSQNCFAIVNYTYSQNCGYEWEERHWKQYGLFILSDQFSTSAWYDEESLRLVTGTEILTLIGEKKIPYNYDINLYKLMIN